MSGRNTRTAPDAAAQVEQIRVLARTIARGIGAFSVVVIVLRLWPMPLGFLHSANFTALGTAIMVLVCAGAIRALGQDGPGRLRATRIAAALALPVLAIALAHLIYYALHPEWKGQTLGVEHGIVSPGSALGLASLAASLLATATKKHSLAAAVTVPGLIVSEMVLVGYSPDLRTFAPIDGPEATPIVSALLIIAGLAAALIVRPRTGWLGRICSGTRDPQLQVGLFIFASSLPLILIGIAERLILHDVVPVQLALAILAPIMSVILTYAAIARAIRLGTVAGADARLASLVEHSDDAIVAKTLDGTITNWNQAAERLFGYSAAEAIGRPIGLILPPDKPEEEAAIITAVRQNERIATFDTQRLHKTGRLVDVSAAVSPIRLPSGEIVGASSILRDITDRLAMERELRRSNAELEQFAYVASHDLQEPLRMVANYVELLEQRYAGQLDERADKYIHYASDGARRMQQLVSDLLAYSRVGSQGKPLVPVELGSVLDLALRSLGPSIRKAGAKVEIPPGLPTVMGDELQFAQLFQNLLGNAVKFCGERPPVVTIGAKRHEQMWRITVADNGIGIDMRYAERIFQMFQRLHERGSYEGSGIGLSIAKRIVERHGGRIWIESEPGHGTKVHFTVAAAPEAALETFDREEGSALGNWRAAT